MNLIVIMVDSLRRDFLEVYGGSQRIAPAMDRLASRCLVFDNMLPECLPTIPARRSLFTGRRAFPSLDWHPWKGEYVSLRGWQPVGEDDMTLAEVLSQNGYVCGLVADCHHFFKPRQNLVRGFHAYTHVRGQVQDPYKSSPAPIESVKKYVHPELNAWTRRRVLQHLTNNAWRQSEEDYSPARVFSEAARWLDENRDHDRLFLWVDCFDPHEPWDPPDSYVDLFDPGYNGRDFILVNEGPIDHLSPQEFSHYRARYIAELRLVDRWLGWFLDRVQEMGLWENSVVVFLSDHGLLLGEHGLVSKLPWALYPELVFVPFMIHVPNITVPGARTSLMAQFHDLPVTLLDLLGLLPVENYEFAGRSFKQPLLVGTQTFREWIVCGYDDNAIVFDGRYAYIFTQEPELRMLIDTKQDPLWTDNLLHKAPDQAERLHALLLEVGDPEEFRRQR